MRAVSNTSPISNLALIGRLDLLAQQFEGIRIPRAVRNELDALPDVAARTAIGQAIKDGWVEVLDVKPKPLLNLLLLDLHRGESEAIALAAELQAEIILIDEKEGRQYATLCGLSITGILGILLRAKKDGHIGALQPEIEALRRKAHFFISPALEARMIELAGETIT
jgi:predicted nucleic acid-binding protein